MFNKIKQFVYILSLLVFVACSDDATTDITMGDKTPIELSVGGMDDGATTRAVITDGTGKRLVAMSEGTGIRISMKSEYNTTFSGESWAFQGTPATKYCTTWGTAQKTSDNKAPINFGSNIRYWDDAHARSSMLSLWGLAVPGKTTTDWTWKATSSGKEVVDNMSWGTTTTPTQIYWAVSDNQNRESMAKEDLCFSNNLADHTSSDNRLNFNATTRKFDTGNMIFYHALTQFTIKIKCGDGFVGDGSDFQFTNKPIATVDNSFTLNGFYGKGVFDVEEGEFQTLGESTISSIYLQSTQHQKKDVGDYYVLSAYVLPGTDLQSTSVSDAFSFTIDHNNYKISMQDLYDAISAHNSGSLNTVLGEGTKLLAGVNYEFTFTVEKTKISGMTAQIQEWGEVKADNITPSNARINLKLEERGTPVTENVDFYRALDPDNTAITDTYEGYKWSTGYLTDGKATASYSGSQWTISNWYWPNNTAFYHFRAVGDQSSTFPMPPTPQTDATGGDYFALTAGAPYSDYTWGAPFLDDQVDEVAGSFQWTYSTQNGFDGTASNQHQIYHGIGPTNSVIKILMFHMMSDVTIHIKTTSGEDQVTLDDGTNKTTAVLTNLYTSGKVLMGNGLVQTTGSFGDVTVNLSGTGVLSWNNYGAIPQDLSNVVLVITTPDKNLYKVVMKDVISTSYMNSNIQNPYSADKINYWYPGFKYEYTFTLSKKKIENITATILDWEKVTAGDDNVQIQ